MKTNIFNKQLLLITLLMIGIIFVLSPITNKTLASEKPNIRINHIDSGDEKFDRIFREGRELMDKEEWAKAAAKFNEIVCDCPENKYVDAAFYWLAYCYKKQKMYKETNETIERMLKNFPKSSWSDDARVMRYQVLATNELTATTVRGQGGVARTPYPVSAVNLAGSLLATSQTTPLDREDEIKLAAFQSLIVADPKKGIETIGNMLRAESKVSETLKREILRSLRNPRYIRSRNDETVWAYTTTHSSVGKEFAPLLKETLLKGFQNESNVKIRTEILYSFASMNDDDSVNYLMQLYSSESNKEIKKAIINSFGSSSHSFYSTYVPFISGTGTNITSTGTLSPSITSSPVAQSSGSNAVIATTSPTASTTNTKKPHLDKLLEIVRTEKDLELRRLAFTNLQRFVGWSSKEGMIDTIVQMYDSETDDSFKISLVNSLSGLKNPQATNKLLNIAKNDKSDKLKLEAIYALRNSKDPEVIKFLEELIK